MISMGQYQSAHSLQDLVKNYTESLYQMDRRYRYFYFYLDHVEDTTAFEKLKNLVENIYTNEYLTKVCVSAAHPAEIEGEYGAQTLAAGQKAVAHGLVEGLLGLIAEAFEDFFQILFDIVLVGLVQQLKVLHGNPPPQGCRRGQS